MSGIAVPAEQVVAEANARAGGVGRGVQGHPVPGRRARHARRPHRGPGVWAATSGRCWPSSTAGEPSGTWSRSAGRERSAWCPSWPSMVQRGLLAAGRRRGDRPRHAGPAPAPPPGAAGAGSRPRRRRPGSPAAVPHGAQAAPHGAGTAHRHRPEAGCRSPHRAGSGGGDPGHPARRRRHAPRGRPGAPEPFLPERPVSHPEPPPAEQPVSMPAAAPDGPRPSRRCRRPGCVPACRPVTPPRRPAPWEPRRPQPSTEPDDRA